MQAYRLEFGTALFASSCIKREKEAVGFSCVCCTSRDGYRMMMYFYRT